MIVKSGGNHNVTFHPSYPLFAKNYNKALLNLDTFLIEKNQQVKMKQEFLGFSFQSSLKNQKNCWLKTFV